MLQENPRPVCHSELPLEARRSPAMKEQAPVFLSQYAEVLRQGSLLRHNSKCAVQTRFATEIHPVHESRHLPDGPGRRSSCRCIDENSLVPVSRRRFSAHLPGRLRCRVVSVADAYRHRAGGAGPLPVPDDTDLDVRCAAGDCRGCDPDSRHGCSRARGMECVARQLSCARRHADPGYVAGVERKPALSPAQPVRLYLSSFAHFSARQRACSWRWW